MSFASFYAGLSGLQANDQSLSVIGNNLANLNTNGYKADRVTFQDIFSGVSGFSGAGNPIQIGLGTSVAGIDSVFSQGSLSTTGLLTDLAIQGSGYFITSNSSGGLSFTRAGNFKFDNNGFLVAQNGKTVQGFTNRDAQGNIPTSGSLTNIQIQAGLTAPPQATTRFEGTINLDANFGADFTTTFTIYDTRGARHDMTVVFTPVDTNTDGVDDAWDWSATVPGAEVTGGVAGTPFQVGSGQVTFDVNSNLLTPAANPTISIPGWINGAGAQNLTWDMYDQVSGASLLTGYAGQSAISASSQDGFGVGSLRNLTIDQDGLISGIYSNGINQQLARVALANFNNENGLLRDGLNTYLETNVSGTATIGSPNTGGRGLVFSNSLELSNVDITQEFTNMIINQRGYQANSRIITTTDEIIQEALALKR